MHDDMHGCTSRCEQGMPSSKQNDVTEPRRPLSSGVGAGCAMPSRMKHADVASHLTLQRSVRDPWQACTCGAGTARRWTRATMSRRRGRADMELERAQQSVFAAAECGDAAALQAALDQGGDPTLTTNDVRRGRRG